MPLTPKHYRYRTRLMNTDGGFDASGEAFKPGSVYFEADSHVPIQLGFVESLACTLGYATLEHVLDPKGKYVGVDAILDFQLPVGATIEEFSQQYSPAAGGVSIDWRTHKANKLGHKRTYSKIAISRVGLCIGRNCDRKIKTLAETATRLDEEGVS